ncbi:MAG: SPASM domain-containing protein [Bacteroidales bacterium]|nr:SPASM domain-containing protein [Bacteroidales bacterium]
MDTIYSKERKKINALINVFFVKAKVIDYFNIFSKITFPRFWNSILLGLSYYFSKLTRKAIHRGMPLSISIEPTTFCNLQCPECPSGQRQFTRPTGNLGLSFYKKIIDQLHKKLMYLIVYFQGEPYLNKDFFGFIKYASSRKIYTATSTNAHFLDDENSRLTVESGLDRLIISLDGINQEMYERYRKGGDYEKVIIGIENIIGWKKKLKSAKPYVIIQFLVFRHNEDKINEIKRIGKELGANEVQIKTAQFYNFKKGNPLIPKNEKYSRYRKMPDGTFEIKGKLPNNCQRMWKSCVISWDGLVVPCCFDKDATHLMGDLKTELFENIWKNEKYNHFRTQILKNRKKINICRNCTEV